MGATPTAAKASLGFPAPGRNRPKSSAGRVHRRHHRSSGPSFGSFCGRCEPTRKLGTKIYLHWSDVTLHIHRSSREQTRELRFTGKKTACQLASVRDSKTIPCESIATNDAILGIRCGAVLNLRKASLSGREKLRRLRILAGFRVSGVVSKCIMFCS